MARLPVPGSDNGVWGNVLNDFLNVEHNSDGTLKSSGSLAGKVDSTRTIATGTGLSGGGDLSADRTLTVTDDSTTQKIELAKAGTLQGTRKQLNLIEGSNITITTADNSGSNRVDVTIAGTAVTKTFRHSQTWTIGGYINVPVGDIDYINPLFVSVAAGQTLKLVACRHRINAGTSATVKLQRNGSDITGFTGLSVTTVSTTTDPADVTLSDGDMLQLIVTAISGTPQNMSFSLFFESAV